MNTLFDICVAILQFIGNITGLGYTAANIWIFVIIHPLLTSYLFYLYRKYKRGYLKNSALDIVNEKLL